MNVVRYKSAALQGMAVDDKLYTKILLNAAPRTLCSIAQLFVIAWAQWADDFVQTKFDDIPPDLRTNLIVCSDNAREAFMVAQENVNETRLTIDEILVEDSGPIDELLGLIAEDDLETSSLVDPIETLQELAKKCLDDLEPAVGLFKTWNSVVAKLFDAYSIEEHVEATPAKKERKVKLTGSWTSLWYRILSAVGIKKAGYQPSAVDVPATKDTTPVDLTAQDTDGMVETLSNINTSEKDTKFVSTVLKDCLRNQTELMNDIVQLRDQFSLLNEVIQRLSRNVTAMGEASLGPEQLSNLKDDITTLHSQYIVAREITATYVDVSKEHILPGANKVESTSSRRIQPNEVGMFCQAIAEHAKQAQRDMNTLAKTRNENLEKLFKDTGRIVEEEK